VVLQPGCSVHSVDDAGPDGIMPFRGERRECLSCLAVRWMPNRVVHGMVST
jgi:hypothetical protein